MTTLLPPSTIGAEVGVFAPHQLDELRDFYLREGFAILRGLWDEPELAALEASCTRLQEQLLAGELDERHGTTTLVDDEDGGRTQEFANYVVDVTPLDAGLRAAVLHPTITAAVQRWIGPHWLREESGFGVVYQDARPGRESSYTRIGWHADWQSAPHLDIWPSVAFTLHFDATSPDNGFLRVVPGSHRWATPAPFENVNGAVVPDGSVPVAGYSSEPAPFPMPLRFEKVRGEVAAYAERGDLLFHDAYLWHSAARATADGAIRRHLRGGFYSGAPLHEAPGEHFVKNAAR
ncbi:phytanoyl-CoA dioxygenase family protein [Aquihabitans sp. G128]|uniref:phytanoyl-CoA dioxygenase family protein n=1 Tax=Aquihabitans sp. G128 TaxID=2849779 RepID=UPI001C2413C5|nr:phytanoyl-CoA dioxygenase family protein [Aquihabitans sp. G128]QXC60225.1 phytanoyl-CoA dioxygenase family protein [Aquihabitans sp. G128]